jgi:hypothetical protein
MLLRFWAAICLIYGTLAAQSPSSQKEGPNTNCIARLQLPAYPPLADAARVTANLGVEVVVGPAGHAKDLSITVASAREKGLFGPALEKAIQASKFDEACKGMKVNLIFHFILEDAPAAVPSTSFGYPNQFWISVPPRLVQP